MSSDRIDSLTQREIEILCLLDARLSYEQIAAVLHLPPGAIQRHAASIYRKLGIGTRVQSGACRDARSS